MSSKKKAVTKLRRYKVEHSEDIKIIYNMFIKPLRRTIVDGNLLNTEAKDDTYRLVTKYFFRTDLRTVLACKATRSFLLPGDYIEGPAINKRAVVVNDVLFIRYDTAREWVVEVEFEEQLFRLKKAQWDVVRHNLKVIT